MKLRVPEQHWMPFSRTLRARQDVESAGIILAERLSDDLLVARQFEVIPDKGYLIRHADQLRIDPVVLNRLVRPARDAGLSVLTVHTHPQTRLPRFSLADDLGDARLMPSFHTQMKGPHGSLVVAGESGNTLGRIFGEDVRATPLGFHVIGPSISTEWSSPVHGYDDQWFERQQLALGAHGHRQLRGLHVGVVGLGGTGSAVALQLAHLGIGELSLVDGDLVEPSNISRIFGSTRADVGTTTKVAVAARYVRNLDISTRVHCFEGALGQEISPEQLYGCDVIMSCVDRHTPRALLNRLAYHALIPTIDMGSAFRVDSQGRIKSSGGRVVVFGPGRPCLACWGHIDGQRLRIEALSDEARHRETAEGYIVGVDVPQPSVVAFNTTIAGAAVVELLRLVTHFAGVEDPPFRLAFAFETGEVRRNRLARAAGCTVCSAPPHENKALDVPSASFAGH